MTATSNPPPPAISALVPIVLRMTTQHGGQWPARIANHCGFPFKAGDDFASALTAWANTDKPDLDTDARRELLREVGNAFVNKKPDNLKPMPVTPSPAPKADATTPQAAYEALIPLIAKRGPDGHKRAAAHLREVTGRTLALPNYVNSTDYKDADKLALFRALADAMESQDYSKLKGQPAAGDKRIDPIAGPITLHHKAPVLVDVPEIDDSPTEIAPRVTSPATDNQEDVARELAGILARIKGGGTAKLDETRVREIAAEVAAEIPTGIDALKASEIALTVVKKALANGEFPMDRVNTAITEALAKAGATRIEIFSTDGSVRTVEGIHHWQLPQVVAWMQAKVPVWLWGQAGAGKTEMFRQIGKVLDVPVYVLSMDPTTTRGQMIGYRNLANGAFVPGASNEPFEKGGIIAYDEIDTADPGGVAVNNALLSNLLYMFPDGRTVERHASTRFIAGANTKGVGATAGYTARNRLDAATLDRFACVELTYDWRMTETLALGQSSIPAKQWQPATYADKGKAAAAWSTWVQKVAASTKGSVLISPRALMSGVRAIHANIPSAEVAEALVFKLVSTDTRKNIVTACGEFNPEAA